ncbi:daunorubicin resistance protein DrrA family ABC transporter ATP-binding protein [Sphaerisporangium siamense]|uniref:ABC-2 type transport system ATP-binding protein n=1 Tax=Sphaerisporangium siamense TaxID=795645 RepID=A0A7W7G8R3_9ACTN|nr:ABC transporter ATP-binding protein [Sphaerisporangium siamense]MBB4700597.1 ABC-2 type transport system ATP-binding protein [Sphaerisporangium siamense]GII88873.1 daunorubicin resistance protein DrrA family ABC transporter ATP-binding protein [Sphaerisporangium siamense]
MSGPAPHDGLAVRELRRVFTSRKKPPRTALDGVSFDVAPGELVTLLGPNGAGKTTTARILVTLLEPTSGTATVAGADVRTEPRAVRRRCGFSFGGDTGLYPRLTALENLKFFGTMYGMAGRPLTARASHLLGEMGLGDRAGDKVETFSRGMRQRLHIARALLHDPPVLVLDEPSAGLDPAAGRQLRTLVRKLVDEGRAVLLTTHDLVEAEQLSDRVLVLRAGTVVAEASPARLRALAGDALGTRIQLELHEDVAAPETALAACPGLRGVRTEGGVWVVDVADGPAAATWILQTFGPQVVNLSVAPPSLEDAYLDLVGDPA